MHEEGERALLVGVDVGASKVEVVEVRVAADGALEAGPGVARAEFATGFVPLDVDAQQRQRAEGALDPAPDELAAAHARIELVAGTLASVARERGARSIRVGVCAPGTKSADGRGVDVMANGPRAPRFCDELERALMARDVQLESAIPPLASDGWCCVEGERRARDGSLRDVRDAYFVGPGTGLAEGFVADGRTRTVQQHARWLPCGMPCAWELEHGSGCTFEERLSMRAIATRWRASGGGEALADAWLRGDACAADFMRGVVDDLGQLARDRVGRLEHFGASIDRIVVGQRLGALLASDARGRELLDRVAATIASSSERGVKEPYAHPARNPGYFRASALAHAAAIGAATLALEAA